MVLPPQELLSPDPSTSFSTASLEACHYRYGTLHRISQRKNHNCATGVCVEYSKILIKKSEADPFGILSGSPCDRFYLLVSTYFHEFYRFREGYSQIVKEAADLGYIERKHIKEIRLSFHNKFEPTIA